MTTTTYTTTRGPAIPITQAAVHWAIDELIQSQPGAYPVRSPGKAVAWTTLLGALVSAQEVLTSPGQVSVRQTLDARQPDGSIKRYVVVMSTMELPGESPTLVPEVEREQSDGDGHVGTIRDLPEGQSEGHA